MGRDTCRRWFDRSAYHMCKLCIWMYTMYTMGTVCFPSTYFAIRRSYPSMLRQKFEDGSGTAFVYTNAYNEQVHDCACHRCAQNQMSKLLIIEAHSPITNITDHDIESHSPITNVTCAYARNNAAFVRSVSRQPGQGCIAIR